MEESLPKSPELPAQPDWYRRWFNELYLKVYSHRDSNEAAEFLRKWPLWSLLRPGDWCLDLGCGAGRYDWELASRGLNVLAVDLSLPLLLRAIAAPQHRSTATHKVHFVRGDMRWIPAGKRFSLAVSLFTSFGYFEDPVDDRRVIAELARILEPGGHLVMDLPNRDYVASQVAEVPETRRSIGGLQIVEQRSLSKTKDRVLKHISVSHDGSEETFIESIRLYTYEELAAILISHKFHPICDPWGDYAGAPLAPQRPRMVYFGRLNG